MFGLIALALVAALMSAIAALFLFVPLLWELSEEEKDD